MWAIAGAFVVGVVVGLALAAAGSAWVLQRARRVADDAAAAAASGRRVALFAAEAYAPLRDRVAALERRVVGRWGPPPV